MDTREERRQRFQHEQQTKKRLRLATARLREAEQERIWAIVAASDAGLSIRQIATATGLSRSRIHQLLQDPEAREIPTWLTPLRGRDDASGGEADTKPSSSQPALQACLADEVGDCLATGQKTTLTRQSSLYIMEFSEHCCGFPKGRMLDAEKENS
jgi:IclR helix-turn-helix domain